MPIIVASSSTIANTSAQAIVDAVSQDVRSQLSTVGTESDILLDYVNRVQLDLLRASRWPFALSAEQTFTTQLGVTDYWLGTTGQAPTTAYDTGLNLSDVRYIATGTIYDRSNFISLEPVPDSPVSAKLAYPDATSRPGRPKVWEQSPDSPFVLKIYPAADNQNTFQPAPTGVIWSTTVSGSLPARVYYVTVTFVDTIGGESVAPFSAKVYIPANSVLVVSQPIDPGVASSTGIQYNRYKIYASTARGSECLQTASPQTTPTWTEPNSGLVTGTSVPPSSSTIEPVDGYVINFRYFKTRPQVTNVNTILVIPDDYKDVVIAGVNYLAYSFLHELEQAQQWYSLYQRGVTQIIRDLNWNQRGAAFVSPDAATVGGMLPAVESIDTTVLIP